MNVRIVTSYTELTALGGAWAALADATGGSHYTQPFWCLAWWRHFGRGALHVAVAESRGRLVALAPLYRVRVAGVDRLRFLGSGLRPVSEILVASGQESAAAQLWATLLSSSRSLIELQGYRQAGLGLRALRQAEGRPWIAELAGACPTITLTGSLADYMGRRPSGLRRKLRKAQELSDQEAASLDVSVATDPGGVDRRLRDATAVFDAAETAAPRLHLLADPYRDFTAEMLHAAAAQQRLALFVLYVAERPAATAFALRSGTTWGYSGPRFDPALHRYSPGHLVLRAIVEHAYAAGADGVDLLSGDARYKREWSTGGYDLLTIYGASSPALLGSRRALALLREAR
ncbi:MAG: GNAT family N-acetyltransferase [Actinomycetota bacterium]|nr:GNAT family N-acetyltransferase [Actinomycetota bacterium]